MFSFGYFPGVRLSFADVSEPSVRSIFKGWMKNILHPAFNLTPGKYPKENIQIRHPVSCTHVPTRKYMVLHILIFMFLDSTQGDKRYWAKLFFFMCAILLEEARSH
jgi:hypothetical protein